MRGLTSAPMQPNRKVKCEIPYVVLPLADRKMPGWAEE